MSRSAVLTDAQWAEIRAKNGAYFDGLIDGAARER